jgi:hypothetical protein
VSRLHKVSDAGLLLPPDATEWVAVYDSDAQLTWTRDALPCGAVTWKKAKPAAEKLALCGFSDWRLASRFEWAHLIDDQRCAPAIDTDFFTIDDPYQWCWTGTECAPAGYAWIVNLGYGYSNRYGQTYHSHVRAVRAGQLLAIGEVA